MEWDTQNEAQRPTGQRRFAGLTAADAFEPAPQGPASGQYQAQGQAWADAWVASELRQRRSLNVEAPTVWAADAGSAHSQHVQQAAMRDFGGASYTAFPMVTTPAGNGYDIPTPARAAPTPDAPAPVSPRFQRQSLFAPSGDLAGGLGPRADRLGYERADGEQDPYGAPTRRAEAGGRPRRRSDALFAALIACGLALSAGAALLYAGQDEARLASAPVTFDAPAPTAEGASASSTATPEPMRVHAVSLRDALGDADKAADEPARSKAGMDKGVERRRR
jgi:hypothetical protein